VSNHPPGSYPQELTKGPQIWATERYDGCCGSVVPAAAREAHTGSFEWFICGMHASEPTGNIFIGLFPFIQKNSHMGFILKPLPTH